MRERHGVSEQIAEMLRTETQNNTFNECTRSEHLQGHKLPSPAASELQINDACQVSLSINRVQCICRLGMVAGYILLLQFYIESLMDSEVYYHGTDLWASDRVSLFAWDALFIIY